MREDLRPAVAEFFGTFLLVFIGAGAAVMAGSIVGEAVAFGVALMVVIYIIGAVSGAHVNPAVTLGVAISGKMPWNRAVKYWIAQVIGAIAAAALLKWILGAHAGSLGATELNAGLSITPGKGLVIEAVMTFFLCAAVMVSGVLGKNGNMGGLAIGLVLTMDILVCGRLTGGSMNPARSIGPAVITGNFANLWVYLVGPAIGGMCGALFARNLHAE